MKEKKLTEKQFKKSFTKVMFKKNRFRFGISVFTEACTSLVSILFAIFMKDIIDIISGVETGTTLGRIAIEVGILLAAASAVVLLMAFIEPRFKERAMRNYKSYAFSLLSKKSISSFSDENTSTYISAFSNDATTVATDYLNGIFQIIVQFVWFVGSFALMIYYSPLLTLVAAGAALFPIIASILTGNKIAPAEKKVSDTNESFTATLKDALTGFTVVKSFKAEKEVLQLFDNTVKASEGAKAHREKLATILNGIGMLAGVIAQMAVFIVGAWLAVEGKGNITGGTVTAFIQLMGLATTPIGALPALLAKKKAAKGLIVKLADSLSQNIRDEGEHVPAELNDAIEIRDLHFAYEEDKPVLNGINARFEAGKSYAVVGGSGCGKSTLLNLLMAGHSGYDGKILYDGKELKDISSESLYDITSLVQQNVFVFNNSIRDNITMFRKFDNNEVTNSIRMSGLCPLIKERGEDYLCGENGSGLSGGERQRISIARALLRKTPVLMVDEATASLDAATAYHVSDSILGLDGLTRIVVTHALEETLLKRYDGILVLKNGKVEESGNFEELMNKKGYFYSLYTVAQ